MAHVVERGIEQVRLRLVGFGELGVLPPRLERADDGLAHRQRDVGHPEHEEPERHPDHLVERVRREDQARAHRPGREVELRDRDVRPPRVPPGDRGGIGGRERAEHHVERRAVDPQHGEERQQPQPCREQRRARRIGELPERAVVGVGGVAADIAEAHENAPQRDEEGQVGDRLDQRIAHQQRHGRGEEQPGQRADDQAGEGVEEAVDELEADRLRQRPLGAHGIAQTVEHGRPRGLPRLVARREDWVAGACRLWPRPRSRPAPGLCRAAALG